MKQKNCSFYSIYIYFEGCRIIYMTCKSIHLLQILIKEHHINYKTFPLLEWNFSTSIIFHLNLLHGLALIIYNFIVLFHANCIIRSITEYKGLTLNSMNWQKIMQKLTTKIWQINSFLSLTAILPPLLHLLYKLLPVVFRVKVHDKLDCWTVNHFTINTVWQMSQKGLHQYLVTGIWDSLQFFYVWKWKLVHKFHVHKGSKSLNNLWNVPSIINTLLYNTNVF